MQLDASSSDAAAEVVQCRQHVAAIASVAVNKSINEAVAWILSDPTECFLYKYPRECEERPNNRLQLARVAAMEAFGASTSAKERSNSVRAVTKTDERKRIDWLRIDEFSLDRVVQLVYDYLSLWRLTPSTRYMVRLEQNASSEKRQGHTYCLSAVFTRQPQFDLEPSNPLAMTEVNFKVYVSHLLPKFFPVMMTYRFENCNTDYYALGERRMRRLDFQRFFIDMALETKLGFYAQLLQTLALSTLRKSVVRRRGSKSGEERREGGASVKRLKTMPILRICTAKQNARGAKEKSSEEEQVGNVSANASENQVDAGLTVEINDLTRAERASVKREVVRNGV